MTPKQLARLGVFYIEEAILEILFQANDTYISRKEVANKLGMLESWHESEWIIYVTLNKLEEDARAEPDLGADGQRKGWKLTALERNRREDTER